MPRAYSPNLKTAVRAAAVASKFGAAVWHLYGRKGVPWIDMRLDDGTRMFMPLKAAERLAAEDAKEVMMT